MTVRGLHDKTIVTKRAPGLINKGFAPILMSIAINIQFN
ncbi:hypothetical protein Q672_11895 [Marinobacter sp. EVN1]|nr:hypothetical protein Q673_16520 [Marinobacter sp. EN3]ERS87872.1 hypothetical protein Q672_11895 [Marinobacter sp. EVN1]ERS89302.1 hypothetical protein Q667_12460 [Marinobacter sp. C1S70]